MLCVALFIFENQPDIIRQENVKYILLYLCNRLVKVTKRAIHREIIV